MLHLGGEGGQHGAQGAIGTHAVLSSVDELTGPWFEKMTLVRPTESVFIDLFEDYTYFLLPLYSVA